MPTVPNKDLFQTILAIIMGALLSSSMIVCTLYGGKVTIFQILMSSFVHVPLFAVGACFGGIPLLICGLTMSVLSGMFLLSHLEANLLLTVVDLFCCHVLPAFTVLYLAQAITDDTEQNYTKSGLMLSALATWAYLILMLKKFVHKIGVGVVQDIEFDQLLVQFSNAKLDNMPAEFVDLFRLIWPFVQSIQMVSWILTIMLNAVIAGWLTRRFVKVKNLLNFQDIVIPSLFLGVLAVSGIIGWFGFETWAGKLAANIAIITMFIYFMMGLSIIKSLAYRKSFGPIIMGTVYFILILVPALLVVVATIGIFEPWLNLRSKLLPIN